MENYYTIGEFLQALKDIPEWKVRLQAEKENLKKLNYLRYEKIKSPLDYEIVGYDKYGQPIREIKTRRKVTESDISSNREMLDKKIAKSKEIIKSLTDKINNAVKALNSIKEEPLHEIVYIKFVKNKKYKDICKQFSELHYDESGMYKYIMRELEKYF